MPSQVQYGYPPPYGAPPYPGAYGYQPMPQPTSPWAIVSLVCGIALWWLFGIGSIAAVVTGHVALNEIRSRGMAGRGLAIAGLVLGYIGVAFGVLMITFGIIGAADSPTS